MSVSAPSNRSAAWAESGDVTAPSTGEQQSGYAAGKPSRRKTNWLLNWLDNAVQWLLSWGIPPYNAATSYPPGAHVSYAGTVYQQVYGSNVSGVTPGTDATRWLRWGHTDDDVNGLIDTKLGTLSGGLADDTVTSSVAEVDGLQVGYRNALRFPNTSHKMVCCRLTFSNTDHGSTTLTLSGGAAFAAGADNVVASLGYSGTVTYSGVIVPYAKVTGAQTVEVGLRISAGAYTAPVVVEVMIQGH